MNNPDSCKEHPYTKGSSHARTNLKMIELGINKDQILQMWTPEQIFSEIFGLGDM